MSALPSMRSQAATQLYARHDAPTMRWDDVVAERAARGLLTVVRDLQADVKTVPPTKAKRAKATKAQNVDAARMAWIGEGAARRMVDARDPLNTSPCTAPISAVKPKTAAQAAKARKLAMSQCSCRLCQLALHPAENFAALKAFGLDTIAEESASVWGPKWQEKKGA